MSSGSQVNARLFLLYASIAPDGHVIWHRNHCAEHADHGEQGLSLVLELSGPLDRHPRWLIAGDTGFAADLTQLKHELPDLFEGVSDHMTGIVPAKVEPVAGRNTMIYVTLTSPKELQ